ncbi:hypothetical protein LRP52_24825 [Photobacterium sp. ZSDE20]|uniref:MobA/MobL protein domain-containing protein n=1 Tax=Photobacterium pectinilyticum TaxID=2906793 RepID=A0ABT1N4A1_9GAMM|nr:hypothetical protein [Photobacterium sp. ZSDE20]MCQ1059557.1 hypothetical protein [Photobacterium sp. ZSDE20]MDD1825420.1 hypothetical protein [Photobacterium sp. ZSDE20]
MLNRIRLFHRHFNYKSTPTGRKKCESSLQHSLRISPGHDSVKQLEWNPALTNNNIIYYRGRVQALDELEQDERQEILFDIAPEPRLRDHKKLQTQQRQYRAKIKKTIASERKAGNIQASDFLSNILKQKERISYSQIDGFAQLSMTRPRQRRHMLEVYLNAHNQICTRPKTENAIAVQEGIFKIPHQWGVGSDVISLHEYVEFTRQFLDFHYPNHAIEVIIGHDDERDESESTGLHTHYYLSGKNHQTGEYDLRKRQIEIVNEFLAKEDSAHEPFPASGKLSHRQSKAFGHHYQRMVQEYTNEHLLKPKGFVAEFADETEKASKQYQHMVAQAKLPKSAREFNFYNRQLAQCKQRLESLKDDTALLNEQKKAIVPLLATAMQEIKNADIYLKNQQSQLEQLHAKKVDAQNEIDAMGMRYLALQHTFANKHDELNSVEDALANAEHNLKAINRESKQQLESIIESVFMLLLAKAKNNSGLVKKFTQQLTSQVNTKLPDPLEPILDAGIALTRDELAIEP